MYSIVRLFVTLLFLVLTLEISDTLKQRNSFIWFVAIEPQTSFFVSGKFSSKPTILLKRYENSDDWSHLVLRSK